MSDPDYRAKSSNAKSATVKWTLVSQAVRALKVRSDPGFPGRYVSLRYVTWSSQQHPYANGNKTAKDCITQGAEPEVRHLRQVGVEPLTGEVVRGVWQHDQKPGLISPCYSLDTQKMFWKSTSYFPSEPLGPRAPFLSIFKSGHKCCCHRQLA